MSTSNMTKWYKNNNNQNIRSIQHALNYFLLNKNVSQFELNENCENLVLKFCQRKRENSEIFNCMKKDFFSRLKGKFM